MPDSKSTPDQFPGIANNIYNNSGFITSAGRSPDVFLVKLSDWRYNREVTFFVDEGAELSIADFATLVNNWADAHPNKDHRLTWNKFCFELINSTLKSPGPAMPEKVNTAEIPTHEFDSPVDTDDVGDDIVDDSVDSFDSINASTTESTESVMLEELTAFKPNPPAVPTAPALPVADFGALKLTPRT